MPTLIRSSRAVTPLQRAAQKVHDDNSPHAPRKAPVAPEVPQKKGNKAKKRRPPPGIQSPEFGLPVDRDRLPTELLFRREQALVVCLSLRLRSWLFERLDPVNEWWVYWQDRTIFLENPDLPLAVALLPIYVEAMLKARLADPAAFRTQEPDESEDEAELEWDAATAISEGLTVRPRPRRERPLPANLPGCHGEDDNGAPCNNLRRYGELYCPGCRRKELERMRGG